MQVLRLATFLALGAISACGMAREQTVTRNPIIQSRGGDFAVFVHAGEVSAVRLGHTLQGDMMSAAVAAIRRSTGCAIDPQTLRRDAKSVQARLQC